MKNNRVNNEPSPHLHETIDRAASSSSFFRARLFAGDDPRLDPPLFEPLFQLREFRGGHPRALLALSLAHDSSLLTRGIARLSRQGVGGNLPEFRPAARRPTKRRESYHFRGELRPGERNHPADRSNRLGGRAISFLMLSKNKQLPEVRIEGDRAVIGGQTVRLDGGRIVFGR